MKNPKYLDWVRTLPCCNCAAPEGSEAHHIKGVGHMSGVGMKASDFTAMPLCRDCHRTTHTEPEQALMQWEWLARTLLIAIQK